MVSPIDRQAWALERLKSRRVTLSRPRLVILRVLAGLEVPISLDRLAGKLNGACNLATVYRTMHSFQKAGIVRQVSLSRSHASFVLNSPGRRFDYLVCNHCESVKELPEGQSLAALEKELESGSGLGLGLSSGFRALEREVKFYGICPGCQDRKS